MVENVFTLAFDMAVERKRNGVSPDLSAYLKWEVEDVTVTLDVGADG